MTRLKGKEKAKSNRKIKNKGKNSYFLRKKFFLSKIRKFDDPVLKKECEVVEQGEDVTDIIKEMTTVLNFTENGVGLACNQIGISKKIAIFKLKVEEKKVTVLINPEIIYYSEDKELGSESCLSYPGINGVVERSKSIRVKYFNSKWEEMEKEFKDMEARIVQHEYDHILLGHCEIHDWWKDYDKKMEEVKESIKDEQE
jgi:peptide deformylase